MRGFAIRQIMRRPLKSVLAAIVAAASVAALSYMQESIAHSQSEIDRLYDTTAVAGTIRPQVYNHPVRGIGDLIRPEALDALVESKIAADLYREVGHGWAFLVPAESDGSLPEDWDAIAGYNKNAASPVSSVNSTNPIIAFSDMDMFLAEQSERRTGTGSGLEIGFAQGFDGASFMAYGDGAIPVIISEEIMQERGLALGDNAYMLFAILDTLGSMEGAGGTRVRGGWRHEPVVVAGTHNGNVEVIVTHYPSTQNAILMPAAAAERLLGSDIGYNILKFHVDTALNRELPAVREELQMIASGLMLRAAWGGQLALSLHDEELRTVVGAVEQSLSLTRVLYPFAVSLSVIVGIALSFLMMLQNAKNAAIMRILGARKRRTQMVLCAEQLIVCVAGLAIALLATSIIGWGIAAPAVPAGLYLAGAAAGSATGAMLITNRPPLELLQVKE